MATANTGPPAPPSTKNHMQAKFDLAISLILAQWPALTLAVQNEWGGLDSADKRDWFVGAVSDLFAHRVESFDILDVEEMLLQVMLDEFEVAIEDGSEVEIAQRLWICWSETMDGHFERVDRMWAEYQAKGGGGRAVKIVQGKGEDDSDGDSDGDEDDGDEEGDVEMDDAPALMPRRQRTPPEVDEDGFTKVVGRRKR